MTDDALTAELLDVAEQLIAKKCKELKGPAVTYAWAPGGRRGGLHIPAVLRMVACAPPGRVWTAHSWVAEGDIRAYLRAKLSGIDAHSFLQEPHGGEPCAYPRMFVERVPQFERMERADGRRVGRGTLVGSVLVNHPGRGHLLVTGRIRECSVRADMVDLLLGLPEHSTGLA